MNKKQENYIFCVDSDGCAMDTMTYKHQLFFGPLSAEVFQVEDKEAYLKEWDRVNLYTKTRGINRFVGLVTGLDFAKIEHIDDLKKWVNTTNSLSNQSLEKEIKENDSASLKKALRWSKLVNESIENYDQPALAFSGVKDCLAFLKTLGNVAVVSSANKEAVQKEWVEQGLMPYVDELYCQDFGKKEDIIAYFIQQGYPLENILMIGDSPGDLYAAQHNQVAFYPILVGLEQQSWRNLFENVAHKFINQQMKQEDWDKLENEFWKNLS